MSNFPEQMELSIVDDLFNNYELGYETQDREDVLVYCETCDGIVCILEWSNIADMEEMELYEHIIEEHREQSPP